jgi:hypothetical protein
MDWLWEQVYETTGWDPSQDAVNRAAGFGDGISGGLTEYARELMGVDGGVNECSTAYRHSMYAGYAFDAALGGAGVARAFGWVVKFERYGNAGGGGMNVLRNGVRRFGADWNRFKLNGKMVNRPHYHRGATKSQMKKHRPWQGW